MRLEILIAVAGQLILSYQPDNTHVGSAKIAFADGFIYRVEK